MQNDYFDEFIYFLIQECLSAKQIKSAAKKALELNFEHDVIDENLMNYARSVSEMLRNDQ